MTRNPIQIKSSELSGFIATYKIVVIKAGLDNFGNFNATLLAQLSHYFQQSFNVGFINIQSLDYQDNYVKQLLTTQMIGIGLFSSDKMLPGYYFFKSGKLAAYHPGTFDMSKLAPDIQKTSLLWGIAVATISGVLQKSLTSGFLTFALTMEASTGINIFQFFKEVFESTNDLNLRQSQENIFADELDRAYTVLNISKSANDLELKKAWKKMMVEFHPDKNVGKEEEASRLCIVINEAHEIIKTHRNAWKSKYVFS